MKESVIIDLGMHPFSDTFISKDQLELSEPIIPLQCILNKESFLIKTRYDTRHFDRYNLYDYSYTSSNSSFSKNHWIQYSDYLLENRFIDNNSKVLEIGSNDGFFSLVLKKHVKQILGIDSSKFISEVAKKNGLDTIIDYFTYKNALKIKNSKGQFNLIIANNVLNHIDDLDDFCNGIKVLLKENGKFAFEVPYWKNTIRDFKYDQIYHEHVNYFTLKALKALFAKHNLKIFSYEEVNYHGGSLRVTVSNKEKNSQKLQKAIKEEEDYGLFDIDIYKNYMTHIKKKKYELLKKLIELKINNTQIIAVGAAAKGNTFLNFHNLNSDIVDSVTDSSEYKIGKYTPMSRIKILSDEEAFKKHKEVYALILSWNISKEIKSKLLTINSNIKFIK